LRIEGEIRSSGVVPAGAGTHSGGALTLYAVMIIYGSVANFLPLLCVFWCLTSS
jgi:hypothetical protein